MSEMSKVLDGMHDACREIDRQVDELLELVHAFKMTGNSYMAERLGKMAYVLRNQSRELHSLAGVMVGEYVKTVDQGTANMVGAALAVAVHRGSV